MPVQPTVVSYTANGTQTNFEFPFTYLSRDYVKVRVNSLETAFSFVNASTIAIVPAPPAGAKVRISRETTKEDLVQFSSTAPLRPKDLNKADNQLLHLLQELADKEDMVGDEELPDMGEIFALAQAAFSLATNINNASFAAPKAQGWTAGTRVVYVGSSPGDYANLQAAVDAEQAASLYQRVDVVMRSTYRDVLGVRVRDGDYGGITIKSALGSTLTSSPYYTGVAHPVSTSFVGASLDGFPAMGPDLNERAGYFIVGYNAVLPVLDCRVDMLNLGGCGYASAWGGRGFVRPGAGVLNAGTHGLQARCAMMTAYQTWWSGANGAGIRGAYGAVIAFQNSNLDDCNKVPNAANQGTIDLSRTSVGHALGCSIRRSGAAVVNVRRASMLTIQDVDGSDAKHSGIIATMGAVVNALSCNLTNAGQTGTSSATDAGRAIYASAGAIVTANGSDCSNSRVVNALLVEDGATIHATRVTTTASVPDSRIPSKANVYPHVFNQLTRNGLITCTDYPDFLFWGEFSTTGAGDGKDLLEINSVMRSSRGSTSNLSHFLFYNPGGNTGGIYTSGSSTTYTTTSDERLKENIRALEYDPLMWLDAVSVVTFDWRNGVTGTLTGESDVGVIAQDLVMYAPEAVRPGDGGELGDETFEAWTVDHGRLTPRILASLKALKAEVDALKAQLETSP